MSFAYDAASNQTQLTWPDGNYVNYDYDAVDRNYQIRLNGASSGAGVLAVYTYNSLSQVQNLARGNGTNTGYGYDLAFRLTALNHTLASSSQNLSLGFGYTLASQLQTRSSSNSLYDYIPVVASTSYSPDGLNRYASVAGTSYQYDGRGNLASTGATSYTYDVENRLLSASGPTAVTLSYDPHGRLQTTTSASATTKFLYDGTELAAEYNGTVLLRRYVYGPGTDRPIVWFEGSGFTSPNYLHADERGSIIATTDSTGTATVYTYGPYGEPMSTWTGSRFRYTGQTAIPEAQLYNYKARVYSPSLGRFLQTDPVGTKGDLNLYAYAYNDPLDRADPTGLLDIYIGGASDASTKNVKSYADLQAKQPGRDVQYFSWSDRAGITLALKFASYDQPVNLIGHSLGAAVAIQMARENTWTTRIANLITIDPVGAAGHGGKPEYVDRWLNVTTKPSDPNLSDAVAALGRVQFGTTDTSGADSSLISQANHGDFRQMMRQINAASVIDQSYGPQGGSAQGGSGSSSNNVGTGTRLAGGCDITSDCHSFAGVDGVIP
jgi:RHS repeat-associated protein